MNIPPSTQPNSPALVLTIDVGSSSLRTNLFSANARQLPGLEAQLSYEVRLTPDGGAEIEPHALLDCLFSAIDATLERAGARAADVAGVGMCSLVSNVMGIDSANQPTTPIYTWADTRCAPDVAQLRSTLDEKEIRERTGSAAIHTSYLPARLLWLKRTAPDAYAHTAKWITLGDWLQLELFGSMGQSLSVASWSGLLNRHTLLWDADLLAYLNVSPEQLPPLVDVDDPMSGLRQPYSARWPTLRNVPWYPCVGDGAASNLGSGSLTPDTLAVQVGTSGAMRAIVPNTPATIPDGLWCYRVDRHSSLLGGALSEGGNLFAWLRDTLNVPDLPTLQKQVAAMPPDSHGLTLLPFLAGERSPGWHGEARATISGISPDTSPADIMRAAQEAVAYRFGLIFDLLSSALPPTRRIIASGGALLNTPGWISILADTLAHPVTASAEPEASSKGAAMLALRSLRIIPDLTQIPTSPGQTYQPNQQRHAIYRRAMQRQVELYEAVMRDA